MEKKFRRKPISFTYNMAVVLGLRLGFLGFTMNKSEFVHAFAENGEMKISEAEKALEAFLATVTNALAAGDEIKFIGFGSFYTKRREATSGRNPRTGKPIKIPAANVAKFKAGQALKEAVNKR
jgi:DNA-binding protein HU-beta